MSGFVNKKTTLQNTSESIYEMELGRLTKGVESGNLSIVDNIELEEEINLMTSMLNFNMDDMEKTQNMRSCTVTRQVYLPPNIRDKCPMIHSIVETLLLIKADHFVHRDRRTLSAMHAALAILLILSCQKIQNNF